MDEKSATEATVAPVIPMRRARAIVLGAIGAAAMSVVAALLRSLGIGVSIEQILGTATGLQPGVLSQFVGLAIHLAVGAGWGLLYGYLFERVWNHGGASTGMIIGVIHAAFVGMLIGLTPQFHPYVPNVLADPGPFFANAGGGGVVAFFFLHVLFGAIVGGGYGHVASEREWAPSGRL